MSNEWKKKSTSFSSKLSFLACEVRLFCLLFIHLVAHVNWLKPDGVSSGFKPLSPDEGGPAGMSALAS